MSKVVYTPTSRTALSQLISPVQVFKDLWRKRDMTRTMAARDFTATYRSTFLGAAWTVLSPLIYLALFTFVFGYVFNGRFTPNPDETPADFALALFVGLSLYLCIGAALTQSPTLLLGNAVYVKTIAFPLEILPVAQVINLMINLLIGLGLSQLAFAVMHGFIHWTSIFILAHILCICLLALGLCWFLSALSVFVRDVPSVTSPLSMVLMFLSGVFFPIESLAPQLRIIFQVNPLALLIQQARGAMLYGEVPDLRILSITIVASLAVAMFGYAFFMRSKPAFADVL